MFKKITADLPPFHHFSFTSRVLPLSDKPVSPASVCYSLSNKYLSYIHMKLGEMSPSYPLKKLIHSFFFFQFSLISVLYHKTTPLFFLFGFFFLFSTVPLVLHRFELYFIHKCWKQDKSF